MARKTLPINQPAVDPSPTDESEKSPPLLSPQENNPDPFGDAFGLGEEKALDPPVPAATMSLARATPPMPTRDEREAQAGEGSLLMGAKEEARRVDELLGATANPMSVEKLKETRLNLDDLSVETHLTLAIEAYWVVGKAAGHLPDFHSLSENMKAAYLKVVRDIWIAAQRKAREVSK